MLSSMTGFGRATTDAPFGKLTVEIQSVNRKYLELFVSLPKELSRFEPEVRKWVGEALSRGQVSVRVFLIPQIEAILPDVKVLKRLKKGWDKLAHALEVEPVDLPFLMQYLPTQKGEIEGGLSPLKSCLQEALQSLLKMKNEEGKALAKDLLERLKVLSKHLEGVEKHSPDATAKMRKKLQEKMAEVFGQEVEERLIREVAVFSERVDISEEITRLKSHFSQFQKIMKEELVGRKLDFLVQEMGREVNTIGSKSMDANVAHLVVEMKGELEKIREQIQNIE